MSCCSVAIFERCCLCSDNKYCFRGDPERNDVLIASIEIFAYVSAILVPIAVPLICR